jgi:hypothetical protein
MTATKAEIQKRVEEIADLRLLGATSTNIRHYAVEQGWGVSERNVYRYMTEADKLIARSVDKNRSKLLAFHHASRRALYARCMAVSDYGTAARVLKDEAELLALYPAKEMQVKSKINKDGSTDTIIRTIEVIHQADDSNAAATDDHNAAGKSATEISQGPEPGVAID